MRLVLAGMLTDAGMRTAETAVPLFMVGHPFGGQALGLLPGHHRVARFYTFAAGAGWHGWMPFAESLRARMLWNVVLPILTEWFNQPQCRNAGA